MVKELDRPLETVDYVKVHIKYCIEVFYLLSFTNV